MLVNNPQHTTFGTDEKVHAAEVSTDASQVSMRDLWSLVQQLTARLNTALTKIEELSTGMNDLRTSSELTRTSVKLIELVMCTSGNVNNTNDATLNPKTKPPCDAENVAEDNNIVRSAEAETKQKRKVVLSGKDDQCAKIVMIVIIRV